MSKRKRRKQPKICHECENAIYVGEGGYLCDLRAEIVIEDWEPTDSFMCCKQKETAHSGNCERGAV